MKIANIDNQNKILGWYDSNIHSVIPTPNVEVTDEQWNIALSEGHNKVNTDGSTEVFDFRSEEEIAEVKATQYKRDRIISYGTTEEQLEYLVENGVDAFVQRNLAIKAQFPKDN
jgi:hypothetical protein